MLIPPFFILSVVALGGIYNLPVPGEGNRSEWRTEGTGFFYGYPAGANEAGAMTYEIYLVTAKHVVKNHKGDILVRVNPATGGFKQFSLQSEPKPGHNTWFFHPDPSIDVAVCKVNADALITLGIAEGFMASEQSMKRKELAENDVGPGDGIFVLGFPMNLAGEKRNHVIARDGIIARVSEMLDGGSTTYMIDARVYPGNSGGPVVLKPEAMAIQGTKAHPQAALIGLVTSYRAYFEHAVSPQTGRTRVIFEENSGLAEVLPIDYVDEAIAAWRASKPPASPVDPIVPNEQTP